MSSRDFDPYKFIDREFEQELFENLLELTGSLRVLAIRDQGGMGKTQLLEKLQYRCRIARPRRIPVCLLSLDDFPSDAILPIIQAMARQLGNFGLTFASFRHLENARLSADFMSIRSSVYLEGAIFEGAKDVRIGSTMINSERVEQMSVSMSRVDLTPEQVVVAQDVSIKAFYDDLRKHCEQEPVVILLDGYEKCSAGVRQWLGYDFLERLFFDLERRPASLIIVITGRELPAFHQRWSPEECNNVVCTVQQLSPWERRHIEECLRVHDFAYETADLESFYRLVEIGIPPSQIVQLIRTALSVRTR
jgi:hypothetical protein